METNYDTIGQHCEVFSGYAFKSQDLLSEGDIPVVKIGNISNGKDILIDKDTQYVDKKFLSINDKYHIKKGDVLISLTGSHINQPNSMVGRSCRYYQDQVLLLNQRAGKILPKDNNDLSFLYYVFSSWAMKVSITNRAYGAANQVNVSPSDILNIKFHFPDYITQQKIAHILSRYDEAIENNNKRIKLLEQMAQNLYKEWFVRFRFPGWENAEFDNGVPKGWKVERLGNLANISTGKCNREDAEENGIYPLFDRSQEIKQSNDWIKDCEAIIIPGEGTSFIPRYYVGKFNLHQRCYCVEPKNEKTGKLLFYTLMMHRRYFLSVATGATVPSLRYNNFSKMKFIMPKLNIVQKFDDFVTKCFSQIDELKQANTNLAKQRDLLLPRLMSGKIEVE